MKLITSALFIPFFTMQLSAQVCLGTLHLKNKSISFANSDKVFVEGMKGMHFLAACIHTDSTGILETEFEGTHHHFSSSFTLAGANGMYYIEESSSKDKNDLYDNLRISWWDGKNAPLVYDFPDQLFGSVVRYAIAGNEGIYFLTDKQITGYTEEEIYNIQHQMIYFSRKEGVLKPINYVLPSATNSQFTSFWFPLRCGNDFSEWYRTKVVNNKMIYEINRIDVLGASIATKEIPSTISTGVPESILDISAYSNSAIYFSWDVLGHTDTTTKITMHTLLATGMLHYNESIGKYFTASKVSDGTQGVFLMMLDKDLDIFTTFENKEMVKNIDIVKEVPKFFNTDFDIAFNEDGTAYIDVHYRNFRDKIVANRCFELIGSDIDKMEDPVSLDNLNGVYYPGFEKDVMARSKLKNVKPDALSDAYFVYTGKGMLYIIPSLKSENVYFIKL